MVNSIYRIYFHPGCVLFCNYLRSSFVSTCVDSCTMITYFFNAKLYCETFKIASVSIRIRCDSSNGLLSFFENVTGIEFIFILISFKLWCLLSVFHRLIQRNGPVYKVNPTKLRVLGSTIDVLQLSSRLKVNFEMFQGSHCCTLTIRDFIHLTDYQLMNVASNLPSMRKIDLFSSS